MKNLLVIFLMLCLCSYSENNTYAQTVIQTQQASDNRYVTDLNLALRLSKDTKQNVVLIFSASWCQYCKVLKNDLPNIKEFDNKIICILDSDNERKLARQFKAKSLPTSIMLNSNGQEISRIVGYDKNSYSKWLNENK